MVTEAMFDRLNNYHLNIILSIDVNPSKFLDIKFNNTMMSINSTLIGRTEKYLPHGPPKLRNSLKEMQLIKMFIVQKEDNQTLTKKFY